MIERIDPQIDNRQHKFTTEIHGVTRKRDELKNRTLGRKSKDERRTSNIEHRTLNVEEGYRFALRIIRSRSFDELLDPLIHRKSVIKFFIRDTN